MKKDRNTFFQEAQMSSASYFPNMMPYQNMGGMPMQAPMQAPIQAAQASQSFYAGPSYPNNGMMMPAQNDTSDLESRISKLERNMQRLDARISKLENSYPISTDNDTFNSATNMYMI